MSSIVTFDWPSVSEGFASSVEVIPIFLAVAITLSMPSAISRRTKPVFDDFANARWMLMVP